MSSGSQVDAGGPLEHRHLGTGEPGPEGEALAGDARFGGLLDGHEQRTPAAAAGDRPVGNGAGTGHEQIIGITREILEPAKLGRVSDLQQPVGLYEGLLTTRAIRRYRPDRVADEALRDILFAASRAPSGSNRQPFRFLVLTDGPKAGRAKAMIASAARRIWSAKATGDGYDRGSGAESGSPKARLAATMDRYVADFESVPVLILPCLVRYRPPTPTEGASVYPAVQNLLLAARALGYGGVITHFHAPVEAELRELLGIPDDTLVAATVTLGVPEGSHGPVRRRPLSELVYAETWGEAPAWATDPPGTRHTSAGPPKTEAPTTG